MDTIQINLKLGDYELNYYELERVKWFINNIKSKYGYTFCDVLNFTNSKSIGIKISYPRFFFGSNVFLISTKEQCFEVQNFFCEAIQKFDLLMNANIVLQRVDIPFTYMIQSDFEFDSYDKIYKIMAMVHREKRKLGSAKSYSDILTKKSETLIYADTKDPSSYNKKIMIYNQFLNTYTKTPNKETFDIYINKYPNLKNRMRIEASLKISRKHFSIYNFQSLDIVGWYLPKLKEMIVNDLLDFNIIEKIYNMDSALLSDKLNLERQNNNFSYELFILNNISEINDYEILRRAIKINIPNNKTRENAITIIRKHLKNYSSNKNIIIMDVYNELLKIKKCVEEFEII
ncbi:hypothetical protein NON08_14675 [Cetobacterium somerae]|uniref:hypothetical protein n=1 Tax=Cetobacterium sp. NK01 TaxID=2993530 RepID=UPI002116AA01|nr:hypothetical protein [Cetobacterium sp. NK01]MCQ8213743.1 hypothetical protein [Cetobacterium sp. NK01]